MVPKQPDICCCSIALLVSQASRNHTEQRTCTQDLDLPKKMAEFSTTLRDILFFNVSIAGNQTAVRITLLIAKATWNH
jgi:hypothetical protein